MFKKTTTFLNKFIFYVGLIIILVGLVGVGIGKLQQKTTPVPTQQVAVQKISYKGHTGVDALTLLKKVATIQQDTSGLVVGINGKEANSKTHTYWAFYVNGKQASVGPKDYTTKDTDNIEWRVEKY